MGGRNINTPETPQVSNYIVHLRDKGQINGLYKRLLGKQNSGIQLSKQENIDLQYLAQRRQVLEEKSKKIQNVSRQTVSGLIERSRLGIQGLRTELKTHQETPRSVQIINKKVQELNRLIQQDKRFISEGLSGQRKQLALKRIQMRMQMINDAHEKAKGTEIGLNYTPVTQKVGRVENFLGASLKNGPENLQVREKIANTARNFRLNGKKWVAEIISFSHVREIELI